MVNKAEQIFNTNIQLTYWLRDMFTGEMYCYGWHTGEAVVKIKVKKPKLIHRPF